MNMDSKRFLYGMGVGFMAGSAMGMMVSPRNRAGGKNMVSRCLRSVGDVIDNVTDILR